jgi:hypothetical protein
MRPRRDALAALVDPAVIALAETQGFSGEEQQAIIALIKEQTIRTHSVDHACSVVVAQMGTRDFEWPEFDRWHTVFTERGHFPPLWDEVERRPGGDAPWAFWQAYQHRKLYLLIDWLHGLIVTRAEMRAALARYAVLGLTAEITRQSPEITCPVCDRLNNENVLAHPGDVPPFHPGCRCLILAAPSRARLAASNGRAGA